MDVDGDNDINEQEHTENDEFEVKEDFLKETYSSLKENEVIFPRFNGNIIDKALLYMNRRAFEVDSFFGLFFV